MIESVNSRRVNCRGRVAEWMVVAALFALQQSDTAGADLPAIEHPPSRSPKEAAKLFQVPDGLEIALVVSEPDVSQPLSISFDDRGRMWVLQYLQYPNPEGLKAVQMDEWLRTKYDKVPEPPPHGPKGKDRISIYEDTNGDGRTDTVKHYVSDLNLASGMALGYDGVFVVQPPYLLFYPDRDRDDRPDSAPEVLLRGFGMEDAHAFANSLTWGPDGWLYGAQGSTATASIRGIGFQQGIWRYHPTTREFELFAEGGGNTWGIDFDSNGDLFAGGNTREPLVHHVQGAYYVKGFGKHGPLHNPHAYGYFQPVEHHGYIGDSLTGGFVIYQGGTFPERFNGACIAPNTRHSASRWSTLETRSSTFATRAAGDFITTSDIWFRPVESTVGPDGALYVADWYDYNISHSHPQNRGKWYMPSRFDGRIWRVSPPHVDPIAAGTFDLSSYSSDELVEVLSDSNDWYARQARRILAERRDESVLPRLERMALESSDQRMALEGLWSAYVVGGFDDKLADQTLQSSHEYVRAWTVRLLGDARRLSTTIEPQLLQLAGNESSVVVRSQLACTAKRLPAEQAIPLVDKLLKYDEDIDDPHVPLLLWWAIEDKAVTDCHRVIELFESPEIWSHRIVEQTIIERLARRYAAEGSDDAFECCARLLALAPTASAVDRLVAGFVQAFSGRRIDSVPPALVGPLARLFEQRGSNPEVLQLALRLGNQPAVLRVAGFVQDSQQAPEERIKLLRVLGEIRESSVVGDLLILLEQSEPDAVHAATLGALAYFDDESIADAVLRNYPRLGGEARSRAVELLAGRSEWTVRLLQAVADKSIDRQAVSIGLVRQMLEHGNPQIDKLVAADWGRVQPATPHEKQGRITAILQKLGRGAGDSARGAAIYEKVCASCHKLHGKGNFVGPDLTGADRKDRTRLVGNIVDPNSMIREQYIAHVAVTADGRVLTGLLAESTPETVTILDAKNKRTVLNRDNIAELRESPISLMPEKLLEPLSDDEIRDLIAYVQSDETVAASADQGPVGADVSP